MSRVRYLVHDTLIVRCMCSGGKFSYLHSISYYFISKALSGLLLEWVTALNEVDARENLDVTNKFQLVRRILKRKQDFGGQETV